MLASDPLVGGPGSGERGRRPIDADGALDPHSDPGALLAYLRGSALLGSRITAAVEELGLTVDQWRALAFVAEHGDASMADVIAALVIPPTSATRVIDALVDRGAVYRLPAPTDRRRAALRASVDGGELLDRAHRLVADVARDDIPGLAVVSPDELRAHT